MLLFLLQFKKNVEASSLTPTFIIEPKNISPSAAPTGIFIIFLRYKIEKAEI